MEPVQASQRIVYFVDDDASLLRAVGRLLRSHGYEIKTYSSASEFLRAGFPIGPACLLLDLNMPGMTRTRTAAGHIELPVAPPHRVHQPAGRRPLLRQSNENRGCGLPDQAV